MLGKRVRLACIAVLPWGLVGDASTGEERPEASSEPTTADLDFIRAQSPLNRILYRTTADLSGLDSLILGRGSIDDARMTHLRGLEGLRELSLFHAPITDAGLMHIGHLTALKDLVLDSAPITDAGIGHLNGLIELERLGLFDVGITDAGMAHLAGMIRLKSLAISGKARVTDAGLRHIRGLDRLEELTLGGSGITDAGLAELAGMSRIRKLSLVGAEIRGPGLAHLRAMARLEKLNLAGAPIEDAGLEHLSGLRALRALNLGGSGRSRLTDAGLAHLARLVEQEDLDLLNNPGVTDAGLASLRSMPRLARLELSGTSVRGPGLERLASLKYLRLGSDVDKDVLKYVSKLVGLEELDLENAAHLTPDDLQWLAPMPALRVLRVSFWSRGPDFDKQLRKHPLIAAELSKSHNQRSEDRREDIGPLDLAAFVHGIAFEVVDFGPLVLQALAEDADPSARALVGCLAFLRELRILR